jgi:hypothetical protein
MISNLTPPLFIEVPVQSQESDRSCICLLWASILPPFLHFPPILISRGKGIFLISSTFGKISNKNLIFLFYFFCLINSLLLLVFEYLTRLLNGTEEKNDQKSEKWYKNLSWDEKLLLDKYYYFDSILLLLHFFVIRVNAKNRGIYSTWAIILLFQACPKICTNYKKE